MIQLVIICQIIVIAQVSPRGGAANGDPPYPRPIHPPSTQKDLNNSSSNKCSFWCVFVQCLKQTAKGALRRKTDAKTKSLTRIHENLKSQN